MFYLLVMFILIISTQYSVLKGTKGEDFKIQQVCNLPSFSSSLGTVRAKHLQKRAKSETKRE